MIRTFSRIGWAIAESVGQALLALLMIALVVLVLFTASVSALRLTESPSPMEHYRIPSENVETPSPQGGGSQQFGVDPWSIHQATVHGEMVGHAFNRNSPLRL